MPYLFSYPTSTLLLDDNKTFLSTIKTALAKQNNLLLKADPVEALQYVRENQKQHAFSMQNKASYHSEDILTENESISSSTSIDNVINLATCPDKYQQITTIVLDHAMPGMDGLVFASSFDKQETSIIMLTGEATQALAVDAFNRGIIDKFLMKDSPNLITLLQQYIDGTKREFFYKQTKKFAYNSKSYDLLFSEAFSALFSKILLDYNIEEYYLFSSNGSYLLVSAAKEKFIFNFVSTTEMNYYREVAAGNNASNGVLDKLNNGYMVCLQKMDMQLPVERWEQFLYPYQTLDIQDETYCYAVTPYH